LEEVGWNWGGEQRVFIQWGLKAKKEEGAASGPLSTWIRGPPELFLRPRRVESLRVVRKAQAVRQATIQQTMPGSVRQPTNLESMPTAGLEALAIFFAHPVKAYVLVENSLSTPEL
jgi:hypothetical protein